MEEMRHGQLTMKNRFLIEKKIISHTSYIGGWPTWPWTTSSRSGSFYCGREKEEEKTTCCSTSQKQESTQGFKFYWWCWDVILGFVFQYKMMLLIPLNPDPFLRFSFQMNCFATKEFISLELVTWWLRACTPLHWLDYQRWDEILLIKPW